MKNSESVVFLTNGFLRAIFRWCDVQGDIVTQSATTDLSSVQDIAYLSLCQIGWSFILYSALLCMPFCEISDDVSLHYITNTPSGDVVDFDPNKSTILFVSPMFLDVTWLREQLGDPRLSDGYNLIAVDQRNMGQTRCRLSPKRDAWVDAADIALAHELLQLPPCHVFAVSMTGCGAALRFAILFPVKCLSLCLCGVPNQSGDDPDWVPQGCADVVETWCRASDLDTLEHAHLEMSWFLFNGQIDVELENEVVAWWQTHLSPTNRSNFYAQAMCATLRPPFTDKELNSIEQPTLILQGDKSAANPPCKTQKISARIPNSTLFVVKGCPGYGFMLPRYASIINRVCQQFLGSLPPPPVFQLSQPDPEGVMRKGLHRLAAFANDPYVAKRDPTTTLSFCQYPAQLIEQNVERLARQTEGEKEAFRPLNKNGKPIRQISERLADEWSPPAFERMKRWEASEVRIVKTETISMT